MVAKKANMFAEERPNTGEVCNIHSDGCFTRVPQHVGSAVNVGEVVDFG